MLRLRRAAATMSDASVTDVESTNPNAQLTTTGASSGVGGSNIQGGSTTSSGTAATGTTGGLPVPRCSCLKGHCAPTLWHLPYNLS